MSAEEIDAYFATLDATRRDTMTCMRATIGSLLPEAEEGLSYSVPAFRLNGKLVAGLSAAKNHLSYLPHSGTVLESMDPADLEGYRWSKGALQFRIDEPLPRALIKKLLDARIAELG